MQEANDYELLRRYRDEGLEEAFGELVRRHVDMVYGVALRMVRDPGAAEDVVQATFIVLAKKNKSLRPGSLVSAWLMSTTRFIALDAIKSRGRRQKHEHSAGVERLNQMDALTKGKHESSGEGRGVEKSPSLDEELDRALGSLGRTARESLVIRFFEGRPFSQVAERLGISEVAARKRVSRALDQLRTALGRAGVDMRVEALGASLLGISAVSAPASLAPRVTSEAMSVAHSGWAGTWATGAIRRIFLAKLGLTLAGVGMACAVGGMTVLGLRGARSHEPAGRVRPVLFQAHDDQEMSPIVGYARTARGEPVVGAEVLLATESQTASIYGQGSREAAAFTTTGAEGRFEIEAVDKPLAVVVRGSLGAGIASVAAVRKSRVVVVQRWGSMKGTVKQGPRAVPNATVNLSHFGVDWHWHVNAYRTVTADEKGNFEFKHVWPGNAYVGWQPAGSDTVTHWYLCAVDEGKAAQLAVGGSGRKIVGTVVGNIADDEIRNGYIDPRPPAEFMLDLLGLSESQRNRRWEKAKESARFRQWLAWAQPYMFHVAPDGSFEVDDVPEGNYRLRIECGRRQPGSYYIEFISVANVPLAVGPSAPSEQALNVGPVKLTDRRMLVVGQSAPAIGGVGNAKKPLSLADFRGKYVLLHLWSSDRADTVEAMDDLKAVGEKLGAAVTLVGVNLDGSEDEARRVLGGKKVAWQQIFVAKGWGALPEQYGAAPGTIFLIGPDGRILAKNIEPKRAAEIVEPLLGGSGR